MLDPQLLHQSHRLTPKSFGDLDSRWGRIFLVNLILAQSIVLEWLHSLSTVHIMGENVMQAELTREDIHHHVNSALMRLRRGIVVRL
jgi:hypothetical protein